MKIRYYKKNVILYKYLSLKYNNEYILIVQFKDI